MNMKKTSSLKSDLDTPCLILDLDILEVNLQKMKDLARKAGKSLRPHAKTHKCSALAKRQIEMGAIGVCAAKLSEAEALIAAGLNGILITGPVTTKSKIDRIVSLLAKAPSLIVAIDNPEAVKMLGAALRENGLSMDVLVDIDIGLKRTGVAPANAIAFADHVISQRNFRLRGIQAYAGHVQHIKSYDDRKNKSLGCLAEAAAVFKKLRSKLGSSPIFSASGTGTHDIDLAVPETTELQVGSYACMDAEYMAIGSDADESRFTAFAPALRLLTTVVSANQKGFVTVDAGLKSLYRDGALPQVLGHEGHGLRYDWFGDEYGKISYDETTPPPAVGEIFELVTSHCDPTVNLFDRFHLTSGDEVVGSWAIDLRGCSQ
jgi:D-serine deaminase-like pyridoxal phosphate-dependent protein